MTQVSCLHEWSLLKVISMFQETVDKSKTFAEVMQTFEEWLEAHGLGAKYKFALATDWYELRLCVLRLVLLYILCSPWDIKECLFPQCVLAKTPFPPYATKWMDVRKMFSSFYRVPSGNISRMLESLGLQFKGREHSGIADANNIARVLMQLIRDGCILKYNRFMPNDALQQFRVN